MHMKQYSWKNHNLKNTESFQQYGFWSLLHLSEQDLWDILNLPNLETSLDKSMRYFESLKNIQTNAITILERMYE